MSHPQDRSVKILSCASCRQRKIKCDKVQPNCTQCTRFSIDCIYPSRKPTRRAPRPRQNELLDRISRLETIVSKADPEKLRQLDLEKTLRPGTAGSGAAPEPKESSPGRQDGGTDAAARYLSGEFWENLCDEVEGIKQALDQPSEDDDEEDEGDSPESMEAAGTSISMAPSGFIFGNPNYHEQSPLEHPPRDMMIKLWSIYTQNVDPLMKFLHRPTVAKQLEALAEATKERPVDLPTHALAHAIYFSAVTCLSPAACRKQLDESRDVLASRYRLAVERALAEADFLNSNSPEMLQALTLYTAMIRCYSHNRNSWALTSLLIRLAQAQHLHRDGDGHRFTPFIAEMRRRLWHFIIVLDIRGSEDRGSDAILARSSYNTAIPTSIDDDAFGPDSTGPLVPKSGPAENVICMCTAMCSSIFGYMSHPHTNASGEAEHYVYTEDELVTQIRRLEDSFIHTATPDHVPSMYASEIARLVILKLWLNIQYPFTARPVVTRPSVSRDTMLRTAISVMELSERMGTHQWEERYKWWTDTYVQWHPLAVALAELCIQPEGDLADRAWTVIDRAFPASREKIADTASGPLWRPIKKLLKKAKAAKAEAMMKRLQVNDTLPTATTAEPLAVTPSITQQMEPFQTTSMLAPTMPAFTQPYEPMTMDPSYLFQYPPELLNVNFDQPLGQTIPMEWSLWNDFLQDTQMDGSPGGSGSGGAEST